MPVPITITQMEDSRGYFGSWEYMAARTSLMRKARVCGVDSISSLSPTMLGRSDATMSTPS